MSTDDVHTVSVDDLMEHEVTEAGDCWCVPSIEPVKRDDGSMGWVHVHHSLDGREFSEPDYDGLPMPCG